MNGNGPVALVASPTLAVIQNTRKILVAGTRFSTNTFLTYYIAAQTIHFEGL
jgi:hypothetical protein